MRFLLPIALALSVAAQNPPATPVRDRAPDSRATTSVSGRVIDAESRRPMVDALVQLWPAFPLGADGRLQVFRASTDAEGRYTIDGLPPGEYRALALPPDFRATHLWARFGASGPQSANSSPGKPVVLAAGESRAGVDIALPRAFAIEGRAVDESGGPMADVAVRSELADRSGTIGRESYTDDRGMFRVYGLAPGTYKVCAEPAAFRPPAQGDAMDTRYVRGCYPDGTSEVAQTIQITGADVTGIEIQLQRSGAHTVSGQVFSESGEIARNAHVSVSVDRRGARTSSQAETRDGVFTARGLTNGEYEVQAFVGGDDPEREEYGVARIRIDGADATGVTVKTSRGAILRGRLVLEGGRLAEAAVRRLKVQAQPDIFVEDRMPFAQPHSADVGADLSFRLTRLFGPVRLSCTGLPEGWAIKSIAYLGADVTDRATEFSTSPEPDALRIVLTGRAARLLVRVVDADGKPAGAGLVFVLPADPARQAAGVRLYGRRTAGGDLDFGFFAPGDYLVSAMPADTRLPTVDGRPDFERIARSARPFTLSEGERRVIDAIVAPLPVR